MDALICDFEMVNCDFVYTYACRQWYFKNCDCR